METNRTLHSFKNSKTSGMDSLPKEFQVAYWAQVGPDLLKVFQDQLQEGLLGTGMDCGLITSLYKKGPREELKNWRPSCWPKFWLCNSYLS